MVICDALPVESAHDDHTVTYFQFCVYVLSLLFYDQAIFLFLCRLSLSRVPQNWKFWASRSKSWLHQTWTDVGQSFCKTSFRFCVNCIKIVHYIWIFIRQWLTATTVHNKRKQHKRNYSEKKTYYEKDRLHKRLITVLVVFAKLLRY